MNLHFREKEIYNAWYDSQDWWHSPDEDTPAVVYTQAGGLKKRPVGTRLWFKHGTKHRETGPAIEYPEDSGKENEYWLHGISYDNVEEWIQAGGRPAVQGKELSLEL